jgi:endonuclease-3 related protein
MDLSRLLKDLYKSLRAAFGHRNWWPGETPFEVMVGAVLTQRTNWRNVDRAIGALREADALSARAITQMDAERLQGLIRPAGYYRQKSVRLARLARWLMLRADGEPAGLAEMPTDELREELLSLNGIGPETADSILLYALGRPVFVVDAYTMRVAVRHGLLGADCGYTELQDLFASAMPDDLELLQDYHAQLVELGKRYCRPKPRCDDCPARSVLGDPNLEDRAR